MTVVSPTDTIQSVPMSLLVVQDHLDESTQLLEHLNDTQQNYVQLTCVNNLADGVKALLKNAYDAVLLDLNLSDSKGLATLIKVRNASSNVSIIVLMDGGDEGMALQVLQNGAQDYIVKDAPGSASIQRQITFAIERKRADETIRRLNLLEQREHFIGMLAHDLRNPVIGSQRMLTMILAGAVGAVPEPIASLLSLLITSNREQLLLINNVLDSYRLEQGAERFTLLDTNLTTLVTECVREYLPIAFSKNIEILNSCTEIMPVSADRLAMRRVISNLLSNAIKFTPRAGKIEISMDNRLDKVSLFITDTGIGMDAQQCDRLFERFYQGESKFRANGLGLGLHLCKELLAQQNATIQCSSRPELGTTFEIRLPKASNMVHRPVLIVDHSMDNVENLRDLLQSYSIDSVFVHGGVEAIESIAKNDYGLVFIDIKSPDMDGQRTSKAISLAGTDVNVVAYAPPLTSKQKKKLSDDGVNDFLEKPATSEELKKLLDRLLPSSLTKAN